MLPALGSSLQYLQVPQTWFPHLQLNQPELKTVCKQICPEDVQTFPTSINSEILENNYLHSISMVIGFISNPERI